MKAQDKTNIVSYATGKLGDIPYEEAQKNAEFWDKGRVVLSGHGLATTGALKVRERLRKKHLLKQANKLVDEEGGIDNATEKLKEMVLKKCVLKKPDDYEWKEGELEYYKNKVCWKMTKK